jgi:hypothetical protein
MQCHSSCLPRLHLCAERLGVCQRAGLARLLLAGGGLELARETLRPHSPAVAAARGARHVAGAVVVDWCGEGMVSTVYRLGQGCDVRAAAS